MADRWLLTQFTSGGSELFNCVALSTSPDPTGTYYRWAFSNGANFPDYPKYGVGANAYYISTRDFLSGAYVGIGAYALNRTEMIAGNPTPGVIKFTVDRTIASNVADGLLPMDIDGFVLPPNGDSHYYLGTMDDGASYGAPQDALTLWKFDANFANPPASSFTLSNTMPISPYDTIFPCGGGRSCIPQPDTSTQLDIQSYRLRPLHRLAYRNFGTHESLVTNQSVEASTGIAGIRWWEVRSPNTTPVVYQEGTYGPGVYHGNLKGGPLNGSPAWCGDPQAYLNSVVDINSHAGTSVQFRFRVSTDGSIGRPGWDIDDIKIQGCEQIEMGDISITKTAALTVDNGHPGEADLNDVITYSVSVENTGDFLLDTLSVNDSMEGLLTCTPTTLAPAAVATCTGYIYTVLQSDIDAGGTIDNTADAVMTDPTNATTYNDSATTQTVVNLSLFKDGFE